jgi:hypothetical protein
MMLIRRCGFTITIQRRPYNFYYSTTAKPKSHAAPDTHRTAITTVYGSDHRRKAGAAQEPSQPSGLPKPVAGSVAENQRGNANNYLVPSKPHSVLQLPSPVAAPRVPPPGAAAGGDECSSVPEVANGKMSCLDQRQGKKCTPVCDEGHVFYQKFSSRPPTYICSGSRVDWKINKFIPDCSPVKKTKAGGADRSCPPGWEWRDGLCVACPPGMFRDSAPLCQLCPKGSFSTKFGTRECSLCSPGEYTTSLGSRQPSDCRRGGGRGIHDRQR